MRDVPGQVAAVNSRTVYVEQSGRDDLWVVFESGGGCGRTCWDLVRPLLTDTARVVAYDRAGRPHSGPVTTPLSIETMADDLVAMTDRVVPGAFVLVAHSMGGLVARRAAQRLAPRLTGLLLLDPTPETSPTYDHWETTVSKTDRMLALTQRLTQIHSVGALFARDLRRRYPPETYRTMLTEDFTPAGIAQTRRELQAVADAIPQFRLHPPPPPGCPVIVLSASRPEKGRERQNTLAQEHHRWYTDDLPHGRHHSVDSTHLIQAEQPHVVAAAIRQLLAAVDPSEAHIAE